MGENSKIEWTHHTFNPWWGCSKVAAGCTNCYAASLDKRVGGDNWGDKSPRRFFGDKHWNEPIKWNKAAAKAGERHRVFCASMADIFEDREDDLLDQRARLFRLIDNTPDLDWLLLTKRPENIGKMWDRPPQDYGNMCTECGGSMTNHLLRCKGKGSRRANVWLGTSIANQEDADRNIPHLLKCRDLAPVLFVSYEPAIGPVDWGTECTVCDYCGRYTLDKDSWDCECGQPLIQDSYSFAERLDFGIIGCESGHMRRDFKDEWATDFVKHFQLHSAAFVKQLIVNGKVCHDIDQFPEHLRVRQFPATKEPA